MPLRRWFRQHGHPGWYSWLVVVASTVASVALAVVVSVRLVTRTDEEARRATCLAAAAQERVFSEAETEVGRNAEKAWHDLRISLRCDEE